MLNEVIRTLRKRKGLTQEQLAEHLGISVMTVRRWEWGERTPDVDSLQKISGVLGVSVSDLLTGVPEVSISKPKGNENALPGLAYWGGVADNARAVARQGNREDIADVTQLLQRALGYLGASLGNRVVPA